MTDNKADKKAKQKRPKDPRYLKVLKTLQEKFPGAFSDSEVKVLKIHIHKDIKKNTELTGMEILRFLRKYCNSHRYTEAHKEGAGRYNLDGEVIGVVTSEEVQKKSKVYASPEKKNPQAIEAGKLG